MRTVDATAPFEGTLAEADLSLRITDAPDPVKSGSSLTYTIIVTNAGPSDANGVTVVDTLPATTTFKSVSASQGSCSRTGSTVRCTLGDQAAGSVATVTIVVKATQKGMISDTATVSSVGPPDNQPTNNAATTATVVGP